MQSSNLKYKQAQNKLKQLQSEVENVQILIAHHSKYLTENLPAAALLEDAKVEDKPVEEPKAE